MDEVSAMPDAKGGKRMNAPLPPKYMGLYYKINQKKKVVWQAQFADTREQFDVINEIMESMNYTPHSGYEYSIEHMGYTSMR